MDPLTMAAIGAPIIGGLANFLGQNSANDTNREIAAQNNATSIELANTSMQRKVTDLKAAGLNPMLAYSQGGSPQPALQQSHVENSAASASTGSLNAATQQLIAAQVKNQDSQAMLNSAQTMKTRSETTAVDTSNVLSQANLANVPGQVALNTRNIDAAQAKAQFEEYKHSNDYNSVKYLIDTAERYGFRNMDEAFADVDFRKKVVDVARQKQEEHIAEPHSQFAQGVYGKHVAPYVENASKALNLLNSFKSGYTLPGRH